MSFSFSSMVRLIALVALASLLGAVGLSRLDPPRPGGRARVSAKYSNLNEYFLNLSDRTPRWLDAETGRPSAHPLEDGDVLEAASCAPWVDEKGQYQVAGRWSTRTLDGPLSISTDFGLARYTFPGGRRLDHVSTEIVPVGPPCWFPGVRARILFAAGDGKLYHYAFEPETSATGDVARPGPDAAPTPLRWQCPKPGLGDVFLGDPSWPEDPRMAGRVLVTLREQSPDSEALRCFSRCSLWWLRLDAEGNSIVEAGRLFADEESQGLDPTSDLRTPTMGTLPDGRLVVAYVAEQPGKSGWDLRLAPVAVGGDKLTPVALMAESRLVAEGCQPSHPSFSADSRWLNAIAESHQAGGRILHVPLSTVFPH